MYKKNITLLILLFITPTLHAITITTGAPKSGIQMLGTCIKELLHTKRSASIKGDMVLDAQQMQRNDLLIGTPVYHKRNIDLVEKHNAKVVYIMRDVRDVVTAIARTIHTYRHLISAARGKSLDQIIQELITQGSTFYAYQYKFDVVKKVQGIKQLYDFWLPWAEHPNVLVVRFEALCGALGSQTQQKEIQKIARFLNVNCTPQRAHEISKKMQSGGLFGLFKKKPSVGNWKQTFNAQHKNACKKIAGQLIIDLGYENNNNW